MDFKIDFGTHSVDQPAKAQKPLYATVPGRASALGNNEVVFYDEILDRTHVMTLQVLQAMDLCREFRSLDEHVEAISKALPALARQQTAVRRVLESLRSQGLLASDVTVLDRFAAETAPRNAPFAGVFVRACDRPAQLQRLLMSLLDYERQFGARRRYVVIDDSTAADAVAAHAVLLRDFARESGSDVAHVTRTVWQAIIEDIAVRLPAYADAARGLLERHVGSAGGIGFNLAMLLSAGSRLALLDDDFLLPLHRHPAYRAGLTFGRFGWASSTYPDLTAALAAGEADTKDPFDRHLAICGETLSTVAHHAEGCTLGVDELRGLDNSRTPMLRPDARVLATVNGHRGHSGAASLGWIFNIDAAARAAMLRDDERYTAWLDEPAVWSGTARHTVSARGSYTPFAIDNSRLMPCTAPDGRGEDALFASLSQLMYPRDVVIDMPFAIGHVQEQGRSRRTTLAQPDNPSVAQCFADLFGSLGGVLVASDVTMRLQGAASRLRDLAAADVQASQAYLREYLGHRRSQRIEALQRSFVASQDALPAWLDDLRMQIEVNGRSLTKGGVARLGGWPEDIDAAQATASLRTSATRFADGLEAWPALWELARTQAEDWLARASVD